MPFLHGGIEAVLGDAYALAEDRGLERERRKVSLHLLDVALAEQLQVLDRGILLVVDGDRTHLVEPLVEMPELLAQVIGDRHLGTAEEFDALLDAPNLVDGGFDCLNQLDIHLLAVMQEPRPFLCLRHVAEYHYRMVERAAAEERPDAAVGRERLVLEPVIVNELRFVDEQP